MRLVRMLPVRMTVRGVVDQVHNSGQRAEDREGAERMRERDGVHQPPAEQEPGEDEQVLGPLLGPEQKDGGNHGFHWPAREYTASAALKKDPDNTLLWRYPQRRLEAEAIRDSILATSGKLNLKAGGPAYFPNVPEQVRKAVAKGIWAVNDDGPDVWRRGIYSYYKRGMKYPMFEVFDQPDPNVTCESRSVSTAPTQALTLLNNDFVLKQAGYFAQRVLTVAGSEQTAQVRAAYRTALSRECGVSEPADGGAGRFGVRGVDGSVRRSTQLERIYLHQLKAEP